MSRPSSDLVDRVPFRLENAVNKFSIEDTLKKHHQIALVHLLRYRLQLRMSWTLGVVVLEIVFRRKDGYNADSVSLVPLVFKSRSCCQRNDVRLAVLMGSEKGRSSK